ncbi:hypothetical protein EYF80_005985 [Liparis tanakae]|uniref:Uncharacterized protein n=1 Tax=Liparis tanakae TaxID=230148 RepID=A0A4Z2J0S2_9TELE|nr:hypothetical protein EYF80_005985 [Liparis tanakae]
MAKWKQTASQNRPVRETVRTQLLGMGMGMGMGAETPKRTFRLSSGPQPAGGPSVAPWIDNGDTFAVQREFSCAPASHPPDKRSGRYEWH